MRITKVNGELAPFQVKKLAFSLKKAGAAALTIQQIVSSISSILYEGMMSEECLKSCTKMMNDKGMDMSRMNKMDSMDTHNKDGHIEHN